MLKVNVKDFVRMMNVGMLILEDGETLTQDEYVKKHGDECVIGFWIVGNNTIGIYSQSNEEFDYWNEMLKGKRNND